MAHLVALRFPAARFLACALGAIVLLTLYSSSQSSMATGDSTLRGAVHDSQGKPLPGVAISLQGKGQAKGDSETRTTQTNTQGNYSFVALPGGTYSVRADSPSRGEASIPSIFLRAAEVKNLDLTLTPTQPAISSKAAATPEFFDPPKFVVSGVTDTTSLGGHGSDAIVHTRESLAKDTAALGSTAAESAPSTGDLEHARQHTQALLARPDLTDPHRAELHHSLADLDEKLNNPLDAVHEYQRAAELNPSETHLFDWGSELLLHHAPEPALDVFTKGNSLFPHSVRMLLGVGASLFAAGSYEEAVQRICEASDLSPRDPAPYLSLGKIEGAEIIPSEALVEKLERFVTLYSENAEANLYLAIGVWKQRKQPVDPTAVARVESLLRRAVKLDPKLSAAYLQLGIVHSELRDFSAAVTDYQSAIHASSQTHASQTKAFQIEASHIEASQIEASQIEEAHFRLAQAYREIGEADKGKSELAVYDAMARESAQNADLERREIRQFVYTLRDPSPRQ
jgi:tetratricopeptide (TPR) repeat protein